MEAGVHSIWISEQMQELGHEVIVANVRELWLVTPEVVEEPSVPVESMPDPRRATDCRYCRSS